MAARASTAPPEWMHALALEVWRAEGLPLDRLPSLRTGRAVRSTRGFYRASKTEARIVVRRQRELAGMRNTLLHELAHAVHWLHCLERVLCDCATACARDGHGPYFKRHLARIEHRHQPGTHSRWGLAGCLGRTRVPARTPWTVDTPCPRVREVSLRAD